MEDITNADVVNKKIENAKWEAFASTPQGKLLQIAMVDLNNVERFVEWITRYKDDKEKLLEFVNVNLFTIASENLLRFTSLLKTKLFDFINTLDEKEGQV